MLPGSFKKTLDKWRSSGRSIPVIFNHGSDNAMNFVGTADPHQVRETADGLEVEAEFDVDANPVARQVYNLLRKGALPGWSFGFTVPPGGKRRRDGYTEISEVELFEVGPTLVGANPEARTLAVKALETLDAAEPPADGTEGLTEEEFRAHSLKVAAEALAAAGPAPPRDEEKDAIIERSRAEYQAAKAAEAAAEAEAEEEKMRRRRRSLATRPRTAIVFNGRTYEELPPGTPLATPEQIKAREELEAREEAQARAAEEAGAKALEEAEPVVSICGVRVLAKNIRFNGQ